MKIYFARHGQTDWNVQKKLQGTTDIPLNATGVEQAEQLTQTLVDKGIKLKKVYCSNLGRARQTAQAVCSRYGIECETLDGLQEMCFGIFEGHTWSEIRTLFPEALEKWKACKRYTAVPEGESYQQVLERVFRALDRIPELSGALDSIPELGGILDSIPELDDTLGSIPKLCDAPGNIQELCNTLDNIPESGNTRGRIPELNGAFAANSACAPSDDAILIVTHGGVLKSMLTVLKDVPFENNSSLEVPNATPIEMSPADLAAIKSKL